MQSRDRLPAGIWVLVGGAFLVAVGYGMVAPILPVFVRSFDVGITAASLVISVFALSRLVFAPMSGRVVGRFGELPGFVVGVAVVAATSAAMAFAAAYWQLLVLRAVGGIGSTMFTVSALSLLVRLAPPALRGRASGWWATGFLLGNIAGPILGGGLAELDLRAPFLVYAGALVLVILICGPLLRGRAAEPVGTGEVPVPPARFVDAVRAPAYRSALMGSFANGWAVFGVRVALVPLFVVEVLGQPGSWSGVALAVFAAGSAAMLVLSGRVADRWGRRPPILAGLAVSAAATAGIGMVTDPAWFLVLSLVAGLGSGFLNPPLNAVVADVIGGRARGGTVLAGFQMAGDLGAIVGPVVAGLLAEWAGFGAAFGLTGAVLAVGLLVWARAPETLPTRSTAAGDAVVSCAPDDCPRYPETPTPISSPTR
ncbi:MFS transporter [Pseudonocardia sp. CA-107938]|uniref:MFS transporter n=1 Tax=Pseudonocardia sp. CA-107938 TaxID=3240021 RepID=UPI003D8D7DAB